MTPTADVPTTFPTLRSVGYIKCEHPRQHLKGIVAMCADCGAVRHGEAWLGGHLEFKRLPHRTG